MHLTSKKLYISKEAFAGEIRIPRRRSAALHVVWGEALCLLFSAINLVPLMVLGMQKGTVGAQWVHNELV